MEGLTITYDDVKINVTFGFYGNLPDGQFPDSGHLARKGVLDIFRHNSSYVEVIMQSGARYYLSHETAEGALKVDSINGVVPTDLVNLESLLVNLIT